MIRVVDSSAWIEWSTRSRLAPTLRDEIPDQESCIVPTIVQYELAKWFTRELGIDEAEQFIAFTRQCVVVELNTRIALQAAALSAEHQLSTADAIIYATALDQGADLLTCDAHFDALPGVVYVSKTTN